MKSIPTPGHTLGHTCYIVDDKILFTGDCLAINEKGGYSFFDFFTQYPGMNKKSLVKLKALIDNTQHIQLGSDSTGHSGIRKYSDVIFAHIDESAQFSKRKPFDDKAPYDAFIR